MKGMFEACFDRVMNEIELAVEAEIEEHVEPLARELVPVRTGALRDSIAVGTERDGTVIIGFIEAGEDYAPYVEFGTRTRPEKPFLRPAVEAFDLRRVAARLKGGGE